MKVRHAALIALLGIAGVVVSTAIAQEPPRLSFEITIDGAVVARPELRVASGGKGTIAFDDKDVTFVPTIRADDITLAFEIVDKEKRLTPTLVISRTVPGSIEWASARQTVQLKVSWVP